MKKVNTLQGHVGSVNVAEFNRTGEYVATGGADRTVKLWNPLTGLCVKTYSGHGKEVLGIAISPDNTKFTSVSGDKAAILWDVATGRSIRKFTGHSARINDVDFNFDSSVVVTGSYDATVRFWDCRAMSHTPIQVLTEAKDSVSSIHVTKQEVLTASIDGRLRVYDIRMGMCSVDDVGHSITSARFSNDENCILASALDGVIRLFDKENGELLASYKGHKNMDYKIISTLSNDDAHVISGSEDGRICFWDLVEGTLESTINAHGTGALGKLVTCVAYHPKEDALVSTSTDGLCHDQHGNFNRFLNKAVEDHKGGIKYTHRYELDKFYPPNRSGGERVRVTLDTKTNDVIAVIEKKRVANLNIYSPSTQLDYRISINLELPADRPYSEDDVVHERNKDRLSYVFQCVQVDLTQVTDASKGTKSHELECEIANTLVLLKEKERLDSRQPNQFHEIVGVLVNNVRALAKESNRFSHR
ncbi:UNVERIFIED_CONTAM: WD repeat-containing protein 83 [Siphonaria sp. JEL0065]|nr:WD repeat-containing protein 83 [Siphonaria sp. JEL0065]